MNTLNVYNLLDGKTLCNIFASLIVNKINQLSPNSKTEISVINVRSFFIVKGITNSGIAINPSEILQEFLKPYGDEKSNGVVSSIGTPLFLNCKALPEINTFDSGECRFTDSNIFIVPVEIESLFSSIASCLVVEIAAR